MTDLPLIPHEQTVSGAHLDLFSISQTVPLKCKNNAPRIAFPIAGRTWGISQGCCNDWTCPVCGQERARQEYGRIVEGCRQIETKHELYFITLTCRGREMSISEALENYLKWTNRVLTTWRKDAKKRGVPWQYVQVTEWQKRGHPHSHLLTTYHPEDLTDGYKVTTLQLKDGGTVTGCEDALRSEYMFTTISSAGLGKEYDVSQVFTVEGASRYVAKYLFKSSMFEAEYPKHWRRVRYSQSFPVLPAKSNPEAFPLLSFASWRLLAQKAVVVRTYSQAVTEDAQYYLRGSDVLLEQSLKRATDQLQAKN